MRVASEAFEALRGERQVYNTMFETFPTYDFWRAGAFEALRDEIQVWSMMLETYPTVKCCERGVRIVAVGTPVLDRDARSISNRVSVAIGAFEALRGQSQVQNTMFETTPTE